MLPKNPKKVRVISLFLSTVFFCILSFNQVVRSEVQNIYTNKSFSDLIFLKQLNNESVCYQYKNISRELEPVNNQILSNNTILFKSKLNDKILTLPAVPLPTIHPAATKSKVPVMMYHDILSKKELIYDLTPKELEKHFQMIKSSQVTPISINRLIAHLRTGSPLPKKPIILTFDDGYAGHYKYAYPLLKKFGYPAVFAVHTSFIGVDTSRPHITWEQLKTIANDPLMTISSHSKTHPALTKISDQQLEKEIFESKQILERQLGQQISYFTYPYGNYDVRVQKMVAKAGYLAAIAFGVPKETFAGQSKDLFAISRFEKSRLEKVIPQAWGSSNIPECN
jgi:peptidoglycan/xylan/chitin deacetylase (PgdA/CDA1 family)